jgi:hypothetical protein
MIRRKKNLDQQLSRFPCIFHETNPGTALAVLHINERGNFLIDNEAKLNFKSCCLLIPSLFIFSDPRSL